MDDQATRLVTLTYLAVDYLPFAIVAALAFAVTLGSVLGLLGQVDLE